jgi:SPP1 gp7 family putative phage head morphogenesis protein
MTAYNEGTRVVYDDVPNLIGYRFDGVDDDRITDLCEYLNGRIISKDDPILDEYTPPFWYNCRTKLTPILTFDNLPVDFVPHAILAPWVQVNLKK